MYFSSIVLQWPISVSDYKTYSYLLPRKSAKSSQAQHGNSDPHENANKHHWDTAGPIGTKAGISAQTYTNLLPHQKSESSSKLQYGDCDPLGNDSELGTDSEDIEEPIDNKTGEKCAIRKRKRKPDVPKPTWQSEHKKYLRNTGQAYMTHYSSKVRKQRSLKPPCLESCRLRCFEKFTHERRQTIFSEFWALGNIEQQRIYIAQNFGQVLPKVRRSPENKRNLNTAYALTNENGEKERVCQTFFMNTLDVTPKMIRIIQKKMRNPEFTFKETRGTHKRQ
uniref:Uncharacterized protein n=1 Tax=Cacopsylla melanoneura TaxID=428564 RepID=A0A8D8VJJ1_9HEMI